MLPATYFLYELISRILAFFADGAAAMPVLAALGLMIGRRGHASFCIAGSGILLKLCIFLACAGLLYFPYSCYVTLLPYNPGSGWISALFSMAGMPWCSAWLAWGIGFAFAGAARMAVLHVKPGEDRFNFHAIKVPFLLMLGAAASFFASYFLGGWPFAGAPAELSGQRVLVAVLRNAFRHWFLALSTGGAIGLALAPLLLENMQASEEVKRQAQRWCALWACACAIPSCLQNWALFIGMLARGIPMAAQTQGALVQAIAISCATIALACWLFCLWKKRSGFMAWLGLLFLVLKYCAFLPAAIFGIR